MTNLAQKSLRAMYSAFKNRLAKSSGLTASAGGVPPASPAETSLQTLTRLILSGQDSEGNPAQSMVLKCGGYVSHLLVTQYDIWPNVQIKKNKRTIDRCLVIVEPAFAPDQWRLAIFPFNGKCDLYEGFVE